MEWNLSLFNPITRDDVQWVPVTSSPVIDTCKRTDMCARHFSSICLISITDSVSTNSLQVCAVRVSIFHFGFFAERGQTSVPFWLRPDDCLVFVLVRRRRYTIVFSASRFCVSSACVCARAVLLLYVLSCYSRNQQISRASSRLHECRCAQRYIYLPLYAHRIQHTHIGSWLTFVRVFFTRSCTHHMWATRCEEVGVCVCFHGSMFKYVFTHKILL